MVFTEAIPFTILLNFSRVLRNENARSTRGIGSLVLSIADATPCKDEARDLALEMALCAAVRAASAAS